MENTQTGKEGLIERLRAMQFAETAKPADRMDAGLVDLLTDMLLDLDGESPIGHAEHDAGIRGILDRISAPPTKANHKRTLRRLLIAAIIAIMIMIAGIMALTLSSQDDPSLYKWAHYLIEHILPGKSIDTSDIITIYNHGKAREYGSVIECLYKERLNILFPSLLPANHSIIAIRVLDEGPSASNTRILYVTDSPENMSITVTLGRDLSSDIQESAHQSENINGAECFFFIEEEWCQCQFTRSNNLYVIEANNYNDVKYIVVNMKGCNENE